MSGLDGLMRLEMDVLEVLCEMEMAGSPTVDIAALRELDADLDHQLIEITGELYRIAGKQWNFDSNPQKQEIFYGKVRDGGQNLKIYKRTASGAPSCDADALEKHAGNELVDVFVQYQDIKKISSTYIKSYLGTNETKTKDKKRNNAPPFNDLTGRIHANFRQTGTKTGRFSCISGDTLLGTNRGFFRVESYVPRPGDLIQTHTGSWQPITAKMYQGVEEVYRVELMNGSILDCTADHRVLTPDGWSFVSSLSIGSEVLSYESAQRPVDHRAGTEGLLRRTGQADRERCGPTPWVVYPDGSVRLAAQPAHGEVHGGEGAAVLPIEIGAEQSDVRPDRRAASQLRRRRGQWGWLFAAQGKRSLREGASSRYGRGPWFGAAAGLVRRASHRRGQDEQRAGQSGAGDTFGPPDPACEVVAVRSVTALGPMGVWDIQVGVDHSYRAGGLINHNCSEPNLQNIPRPDTDLGKRIRGLFIADPNEKLIVADWSQIEYRILAQYSGDTRLIQAFRDELDFHQYVASLLLAKPMDEVTKVERTLSKNVNFACIYGAGVDKVAVMSGVTLRQAEEFLGEHKRMLKGVYEFTAGLISAGRRSKPPHVKTMLGRLRRLPDLNSTEYGRRGYAERQLVNAKIQGSAADLCKLSMVRQHELVKADGISMPLRLTVHDELVWSVPTTDVEHGLELVREAMMGRSMAKLLDPVPLVADIKVVDRWAEAK